MRNLRRTLSQTRTLVAGEPRWRWLLLVSLALLVTLFEALGALVIFVLLALVASPDAAVVLPLVGDLPARFPDMEPRDLQLMAAAAAGVFFLLRFGLVTVRSYVQHRVISNTGARVAGELFRGYLSMPYLFHSRRNSAELVRNTFDATQKLVMHVLRPIVDIAAETVLVIGMAVILVLISPTATALALVVLGPTVLLLQRVIQPRLERLGREAQDTTTASIAAVQQPLEGIRDIKLAGREDAFAGTRLERRLELSRAQYLWRALAELPRAMIETALVLTIVAVFMAAVMAGTGVEELLSTLGLFAYAGLRLQPSLQRVVAGLNDLRFSSAALDDLTADRELLQAWQEQHTDVSPEASSAPVDGDPVVELRGVDFSYDGGTPAVQDVDLTIRRGEFVGICGPTGGGKSTLVDLIVGLLRPPGVRCVSADARCRRRRPTGGDNSGSCRSTCS